MTETHTSLPIFTTLYDVHLYREMCLTYRDVRAATFEQAAQIARDLPSAAADAVHDCKGETFGALVDEPSDDEYECSERVDFDAERLRQAAPALLAACRLVVERWERGDLAEAARACADAVAEATGQGGQDHD